MASIDELKANITSGFALADRFEVQLPPLQSMISSGASGNLFNILTGSEPVNFDILGGLDNILQEVRDIPLVGSFVDPVLERVGITQQAQGVIDLANRFGLPFGPKLDINPARRTSLFCTGVNMPGRQITTIDRTIGMVTQAMPYGFVEDDVTMTFRLDNAYTAFTYFYVWQNNIIGTDIHEVSYKNQYARDITISQLNKNDNKGIYKVKLIDAFPKSIQSIQLADANQDTVVEMTVDIAYTRWETAQ